ncbi:hypothetical protein OEZ86_000896 [Tetradesmus obliquus]|nr:hypothetical protein OEZ86_000896 [Tetradesmus obliquus]
MYLQGGGGFQYASDADGDPLALTHVGTAKYGSVSTPQGLGVDKPIVYKPDPALIKDPSRELLDTFGYTVSDGKGQSASSRFEITIKANQPPFVSEVYVGVTRNRSVVIDLQLSTANETSFPVYELDNDVLRATVNTAKLQYGKLVQLGNGLYSYAAFPGVNDFALTDTASYTVTDGR